MGMTMTEKILAQHAGRDAVQAGDLLVAQVDLVLANDITGPPAIAEFEKIGRPVFDKDKIALVPDHFSPCKDIKSATMCKRMRDFARQHEITNYFEVGRMGIEHALLPDSGLVAPGEIIIGADSHTCTYGALNALSTGMGQTDIGAAMASGTTWFKVPATIKVELTGKLPKYHSYAYRYDRCRWCPLSIVGILRRRRCRTGNVRPFHYLQYGDRSRRQKWYFPGRRKNYCLSQWSCQPSVDSGYCRC